MINTKEHFVDRASILPRHQIKGFNSFGLSLAYRISVNHCKGIAGTEAGCFTLQRASLTLVDFNFPFLIFTQFWIFLPHLYDERTSFLSSLLIIRKQEIFVSWNGKRWFRGWKSSYVSVLTPLRLTALKQIDCHLKKLITKHNFAIYRRHSCNPPNRKQVDYQLLNVKVCRASSNFAWAMKDSHFQLNRFSFPRCFKRYFCRTLFVSVFKLF